MDASLRGSELDPKYLLGQLNTARKEINNLRQQVKGLRYVLEKDVDGIRQAIRSYVDGKPGAADISLLTSGARPGTSFETDDTLKLKPIGLINTGFPSKRATPRQPGICKTSPGKITLFNSTFTNPEHALTGLKDFSHMWILFHFHRNDSTHVRAKVAPPRLNGARIGVFSTRSPHRPCPIGLSLVKIVKIESNAIYFEGVDMVDETPVLDIKPYIPQYDNPLHIEKMLVSRPNDDTSDISEISDITRDTMTTRQNDDTIIHEDRLNRCYVDHEANGESLRFAALEHCNAGNGEETLILPNITRDEEIAMRLQAEEFESDTNFHEYRRRDYFVPNISNEDPIVTGNIYNTVETTNISVRDTTSSRLRNYEQNIGTIVNEQRATSVIGNLENSSTETDNNGRRNVTITRETQISRNSRLLDGADGPSTVCGTDIDLINRRALNSRSDNSPIRMGVREAPDGEEGLESQTIVNSQTHGNIQNVTSLAASANITEIVGTNQSHENIVTRVGGNFRNETIEIRVPDWISRPRTIALSVIFNERAQSQLIEILGDKADEQKSAIESVLREDPRSVYLRQRWGNQFYTFLIHDLHISCRFDDNRGIVTVFQVRHAGRTCECGEPEWQCLGHSPLA